MNTDLKKAIIGLIHNLSVKSYNRTRVNDAIDKIVESSGGGSDDGVPIFYVENSIDTLKFTLVQGKPKVNEWGDLENPICLGEFFGESTYYLTVCGDYLTCVAFNISRFSTIAYENNTNYVEAFSQLKVGESVTINKSDLEVFSSFSYRSCQLNSNKNFDPRDIFYEDDLAKMTISYWNNNNTYLGHVVRIDHANLNIYVSINNELWKYSYTLNANRSYTNITFVEVVS